MRLIKLLGIKLVIWDSSHFKNEIYFRELGVVGKYLLLIVIPPPGREPLKYGFWFLLQGENL